MKKMIDRKVLPPTPAWLHCLLCKCLRFWSLRCIGPSQHNNLTSHYHLPPLPRLHFIIFFLHAVSILPIIPSPARPGPALHCKEISRHAQPEVNTHHAYTLTHTFIVLLSFNYVSKFTKNQWAHTHTHTLEKYLIRPDLQASRHWTSLTNAFSLCSSELSDLVFTQSGQHLLYWLTGSLLLYTVVCYLTTVWS